MEEEQRQIQDQQHSEELQQSETGQSPETSKERVLSKPALVTQQSSQAASQQSSVDIVDRCLTWAKQRQQRLAKAQEDKEEKEKKNSECTFKPDLAKSKTIFHAMQPSYSTLSEFQAAIHQENQQKGFDKYLQRMDKAKQNRIEKERLEEQLFRKEKQWKPQITQPVEPKLSAFINKKERDVNVKALNKPVDIHENSSVGSTVSKIIQKEELKKQETGKAIKHTQDYLRITQQNKDKYVEIKGDMSYDDAVSLIHMHILNLEI